VDVTQEPEDEDNVQGLEGFISAGLGILSDNAFALGILMVVLVAVLLFFGKQ